MCLPTEHDKRHHCLTTPLKIQQNLLEMMIRLQEGQRLNSVDPNIHMTMVSTLQSSFKSGVWFAVLLIFRVASRVVRMILQQKIRKIGYPVSASCLIL